MVKREKKSGISPFAIIVFVLLIVYTATFLVPLIWGVNISLKTDNNAELHPFGLNLPLMFKNYGTVFKEFSVTVYPAGAIEPQVYYMENMLWFTLVYAVACSFVNIAVTCLVAYVTARFNFRICRIIDAVVIVAMILPIVGSMPSELRIMRALGMYDTLWGMMIMKANFVGGTTFLIFNVAFKGFPKDFEEAAQIDGCNSIQVLWYVVVPILKPAIISVALFQFMWSMNDFIGPLIYVYSVDKYPIALALKMSIDVTEGAPWNEILAMASISILPSIIVFFLAQRYFVQGVTSSGIKG